MKSLRIAALSGLVCVASAPAVLAQGYPNKPVRVLVPFAAGGAVDILGRTMAQALSESLGQSFVVENRPGVGGLTTLEAVAAAAPDGYTIAVASAGPMSVSPSLFAARAFDPIRQLEPVIIFANTPGVIVGRPDLPAANVSELVALSKTKAGGLTMGSAGSGSVLHLMGEYFQNRQGLKWTHVPYKGSNPALLDLAASRVDVMVDVVPTAAPYVKTGKLKGYATTTQKRASQLPDLATLEEQGFRGYDMGSWMGIAVPKGTSAEIVGKLNGVLNAALRTPEMQSRLVTMGAEPEGGAPSHFAQRLATDLPRWAEVIRSSGTKVE
jgi:tripartite-type tricarboxylate transporter receptor subunit TctC